MARRIHGDIKPQPIQPKGGWKAPRRNYDKVQFGELRSVVEPPYNEVHDELSACYYDKKPFRGYGLLDKATFDKLHGLIFDQLHIAFHAANLAQPVAKRIPESAYNEERDIDGIKILKKNVLAAGRIARLKTEGIELVIEERVV